MTSRAYVRTNPMLDGVDLALRRETGGAGHILIWPEEMPRFERVTEEAVESPGNAWLGLHDDDARAIYEALGDYFGHTGHDIRALRKDYDAERQRVDRMLEVFLNPIIRTPGQLGHDYGSAQI